MKKNRNKSFIRLVFSEGETLNQEVSENEIDLGVQLEMFPGGEGHSTLIIFVQPTDLNFGKVFSEIKKDCVRTILDIREIPFLNFKKCSRETFFDTIKNERIIYFNIHRWMKKLEVESVKDFFFKIENETDRSITEMRKTLQKIAVNGPLVVFSDSMPETDESVLRFQKELKQAEIDFSAYYFQ